MHNTLYAELLSASTRRAIKFPSAFVVDVSLMQGKVYGGRIKISIV